MQQRIIKKSSGSSYGHRHPSEAGVAWSTESQPQADSSSSDRVTVRSTGVPDSPWLESSWDKSCDAYLDLRQLYSSYFDSIHRLEGEERVLVDLVLCQLNCFVGIDALLDRRLLLLLVNTYAATDDRYLYKNQFIRLMFFLCYASKEQLEEAVFDIVSGGQDRVTVGQLVCMHTHLMQRRMSCHVIDLIGECDRSGCGLLDVYDFRLLVGRLQESELRECTQVHQPAGREREKLEEALLEARELQSWSWDIGEPHLRCSSQLRSLVQCRNLLEMHPRLDEAASKLAWDYPEILSAKFVKEAVQSLIETETRPTSVSSSSSDNEVIAIEPTE